MVGKDAAAMRIALWHRERVTIACPVSRYLKLITLASTKAIKDRRIPGVRPHYEGHMPGTATFFGRNRPIDRPPDADPGGGNNPAAFDTSLGKLAHHLD